MSNTTSTAPVVINDEGLTFDEVAADLTERYRTGDRKAKAGVRSEVRALMANAAEVRDVEQWLAWTDFEKGLAPEKSGPAPVDYQHEAWLAIMALEELADAIRRGELHGLPEGFVFNEDHNFDYVDGQEAIQAKAKAYAKVVKFGSVAKAPKGNIVAHIEEVFADLPSGTFLTEAQIQGTFTKAYPEGTPKGGNVHASLWKHQDTWATKGIIATAGTGSQPAGATKA